MDNKYFDKLLNNWEEVYKRGQLTLWILLSLKEGKKYIEDIKRFIKINTDNTLMAEEQSLYRALRRFYKLEIIDFELQDGSKGPQRKYYYLTNLGKKLLNAFIDRNMKLFYKKNIGNIINN